MRTSAYVNHGRWVADCPRRRDGCGEAHLVSPGHRFECSNCGALAMVDFPADSREVEAVLAMRPVPESRNWLPGETLTDLMNENLEHGVI